MPLSLSYFISTSLGLSTLIFFRGERLASISDRDNDPDVSIFGGGEDRETVSIAESFGVSVENRNWSKVGQTFSAVKEKGDGSAPVEEFSSAAAKIRRRRRRRGRRSGANISTTSCRVHLAVISSAATGIPPIIYRERHRHGCQLQRRPPIRLLSHPLPPLSPLPPLLLPTSVSCDHLLSFRSFLRSRTISRSNLSLDTCYQLRDYTEVGATCWFRDGKKSFLSI